MSPSKERKLPHVVFFHQRQHEPNKAHDVHGKGNESVIAN